MYTMLTRYVHETLSTETPKTETLHYSSKNEINLVNVELIISVE